MRIFGHGTLEPDNLINSAASFGFVRSSGADGVELDVRLTMDHHPVVIHDPVYPDGRPVVTTFADARPPEVLLLSDALDLCAGLAVNIEIKNYPSDQAYDPSEQLADVVDELLAARARRDRVLVSSFGPGALDRVRERSAVPTALLVLSRKPAPTVIAAARRAGHSIVHPYVDMCDDTFMNEARAHGLEVNVWTGFDETDETIERLLRLGVDGVITADPERAVLLRG